MPFAQGARTSISYVPEVTFGTTPASPQLVAFPYTSFDVNLTKDRIESAAIMPDRMARNDRHGNRSVSGSFAVEMCGDDFDPFLEGVMMNSYATNVLKVGSSIKHFTFEDGALDINQYRIFTGVTVGSMNLSVRPNQIVTAEFGVVGKGMTLVGTSIDASKTAASGNQPFDSCTGTIGIANAGVAPAAVAYISGIDLSLDNSLSPTFVVGNCETPQLEYGMFTLTGTITAFFQDNALYNRFINETETAINFTLTDPGAAHSYTFLIPRAKINTANLPASAPTSRTLTMEFSAIYDTTTSTILQITRTNV